MSPITINGSGTLSGVTAGLTADSMPTGSVVQTVNQFTDAATTVTGQDTWGDTGLTANITPASSSNKVLVTFNAALCGESEGYGAYRIMRDSTEIGSSSLSTSGEECKFRLAWQDTGNSSRHLPQVTVMYLDSPSTTSQVTYKLQMNPKRTDSKSSYLNRPHHLDDTNKFAGTSSTILMEIKG